MFPHEVLDLLENRPTFGRVQKECIFSWISEGAGGRKKKKKNICHKLENLSDLPSKVT